MNYINQRNYNDLINWLMNYCLDNGIGAVLTNELPDNIGGKSYLIPANLVIVNNKWQNKLEVPFIFAHEIGHIFTGVPCSYHASITNNIKEENEANKFAINLLRKYCKYNDIHFDNYYNFAQIFCIPKKYFYLVPDSQEDWILS